MLDRSMLESGWLRWVTPWKLWARMAEHNLEAARQRERALRDDLEQALARYHALLDERNQALLKVGKVKRQGDRRTKS